jgi:hypothetical protein
MSDTSNFFYIQNAPGVEFSNMVFINGGGPGYYFGGGAIYSFQSKLMLRNSLFFNNKAQFDGGAVAVSSGRLIAENNEYVANIGRDGGALYLLNADSSSIIQNLFLNNESHSNYAGGISLFSETIVNQNTFSGQVGFEVLYSTEFIDFHNNIMSGNPLVTWNFYHSPDAAVARNNLIDDFSKVQGFSAGIDGNIEANPLFIDPIGSNYHLMPCSPAIDAGNDYNYPLSDSMDLSNAPRFNRVIDMGVYEHQGSMGQFPNLYVRAYANYYNDGSQWQYAIPDLQIALDIARTCKVDSILMAEGTYNPGLLRTDFFDLPDSIILLGGYSYDGLIRDIDLHATILSGDLGVPGDSTDNSYRVVNVNNDVDSVILDGLIVGYGQADGALDASIGAAMRLAGKAWMYDLIISGNYSQNGGPILFSPDAEVHLYGCTLIDNKSGDNTAFDHPVGAIIYIDANTIIDPLAPAID